MKTKRTRRKKRTGISLALLLAALLVPAIAATKKSAPEAYALVAGSVFQGNGYALPNADVRLAPDPPSGGPPAKIKKMKAVSDSRGEFVFRVPAGAMRYTLNVAAKGYHSQEKSVQVQGDERVDVTFQLQPESK